MVTSPATILRERAARLRRKAGDVITQYDRAPAEGQGRYNHAPSGAQDGWYWDCGCPADQEECPGHPPHPQDERAALVERLTDDAMCFAVSYGLRHPITLEARERLVSALSSRREGDDAWSWLLGTANDLERAADQLERGGGDGE